jgi:hypothetical protein
MFTVILWNICVIATAFFAVVRGAAPERIGAVGIIVASYASVPSTAFFGAPELAMLTVDCVLLGSFLWLLVTTDRFWPIWATGFHAISVVTHLAVAVQPHIIPIAYATYAIFWGYPVLASLAWGTWHQMARKSATIASPI